MGEGRDSCQLHPAGEGFSKQNKGAHPHHPGGSRMQNNDGGEAVSLNKASFLLILFPGASAREASLGPKGTTFLPLLSFCRSLHPLSFSRYLLSYRVPGRGPGAEDRMPSRERGEQTKTIQTVSAELHVSCPLLNCFRAPTGSCLV